METFITIFLGLITSILATTIILHFISPKVSFSEIISKIPYPSSDESRYRVRVHNAGRKEIIDIEIIARIEIKGMHASTPNVTQRVNLKIMGAKIPRLERSDMTVIRLMPNDTEVFSKSYFPDRIRLKKTENKLTLEDIFDIPQEVSLVIFVFGYDKFSGARKLFVSNAYNKASIFEGKFSEYKT